MKLADLLSTQPPLLRIPKARAEIGKKLLASGKKLVVIDDDPTGMQTVQEVNVYMDWSVDVLRKALGSGPPVFFVSVNSRSLGPDEAKTLAFEVGSNLHQAAELEKAGILLASRSDSTLRGHFPYEVDALIAGFGMNPDGVILAPAFFEAGRYTIDDTHWAEQGGDLVPVHQTEFARDPMFSFKNSDLKAWVEEKTGGAVKAGQVRSIPLGLVRRDGPVGVTKELINAHGGRPIVVNGACYEDYEVLCLGIQAAEEKGKRFVYRCSASFLKARGGFEDRPVLTHKEMIQRDGPGLIVAGSYVEKTSRQLRRLLEAGLGEAIEIRVEELQRKENREREIRGVSTEVDRKLDRGETVVLYTSRKILRSPGKDFAETGKSIMEGICEVVKHIHVPPAFVVAKGGITSIQVAKDALGAKEAFALGQILPGVPVWRLGSESRWPGLPFVVFPGNVGDDGAVLKAVMALRGK